MTFTNCDITQNLYICALHFEFYLSYVWCLRMVSNERNTSICRKDI